MPYFTKKPVTVEARQFDGTWVSATGILDWMQACVSDRISIYRPQSDSLLIPTLEGDHLASPGDWIIKGVKGEFYPCKPDIFDQTYEPTSKENLCDG
jgi:hypothetical protein